MLHMLEALRRRTEEQAGQTMAEYSVVLSVITLFCVGAFALLAGNVTTALSRVAGFIS